MLGLLGSILRLQHTFLPTTLRFVFPATRLVADALVLQAREASFERRVTVAPRWYLHQQDQTRAMLACIGL